MRSLRQAYNDKSGDFALADRQDPSRDTAAAAEAKNADKGVASGSTRKSASDTGRPSESAPTASEVRTFTSLRHNINCAADAQLVKVSACSDLDSILVMCTL